MESTGSNSPFGGLSTKELKRLDMEAASLAFWLVCELDLEALEGE